MRRPQDTKRIEKAGRFQQATQALVICRRLVERVWPFAKTSKRSTPPVEARTWANRLEEEKSSLISLVQGMETEFLATGEGLKRLAGRLNEIQKECQPLTDLTLGRVEDAAVQFAFQLLKKAEDLVLASYDRYHHVFATLSELQRSLAQLPKQHDELMRVLLPLNFITTAFRIEASRHSPEVRELFFTLAASVNRMVGEVRGTLERQFEELAASERIARSLMEQVSASIQRHQQEVAETLATSRNDLSALNQALTTSGAEATGLTHLNQTASRHISSIVMAQQCQDITRQRIEHVGEAIDNMRVHLDDPEQTPLASQLETRQFVFRAGQIQLQQVQNVFDELDRSAAILKSGIQSLRTQVGAATDVAVKVGAAALDAKIASQCQANVDKILAITKQAIQKITDILAAFEPLQARFIDCTRKATELARDVRHAALNAQVFAIHATDGATLEILAGHLRVISDDAIRQVEQLGTALHFMAELVLNLCQRLADFQQLGQGEQRFLTDESVISRNKLSDLERTIPLLVQRITQQQGAFAACVEEVLANVRFPVTVAEASSRSIGFFRDLVAWGSEGGSGIEVESAAAQKIDLLKSKYTMESERQTHSVALQPAPVPISRTAFQPLESRSLTADGSSGPVVAQCQMPEVPSSKGLAADTGEHPPELALSSASEGPGAGDNLGDNVELF